MAGINYGVSGYLTESEVLVKYGMLIMMLVAWRDERAMNSLVFGSKRIEDQKYRSHWIVEPTTKAAGGFQIKRKKIIIKGYKALKKAKKSCIDVISSLGAVFDSCTWLMRSVNLCDG